MDNNNLNNNSEDGGELIIIVVFFFIFVVCLMLLFFLRKKEGTPVPKPSTSPGLVRAPGGSPGPTTGSLCTVTVGGYTYNSTNCPGPSSPMSNSPQSFSPQTHLAPSPNNSPFDPTLMNILKKIEGIIVSEQFLANIIADIILNPHGGMLQLLGALAKKIVAAGEVMAKTAKSVFTVLSNTTRGKFLAKFSSLTELERAKLGLRFGKESARLGESASLRAATEGLPGAEGMARALATIGRGIGGAALGAGKLAGGLAAGLLTDPLTYITAIGIAMDETNFGHFNELRQTSDWLDVRKSSGNDWYNNVIDCTSTPLGPSCPPSPAASPAPAPAPSPGPAPPPVSGTFPNFLGPIDYVDPLVIMADAQTEIYSMFTDPGDPNGGFAKTINLLPISSPVKTALSQLYESVRTSDNGGTANYLYAPFIWADTDSQAIIQNAITTLQSASDANSVFIACRLKIHLAFQQITADYIVWLVNNNAIAQGTDITGHDFNALILHRLPDSIWHDFSVAYTDIQCTNYGGVVFNPGPGYNPHTCTWANKEDCHGQFPWMTQSGVLVDDATQNDINVLCMSTCPAPCPAGTPSPACPPPIPCPAPSPCAATQDPTKSNAVYSEWRDSSWFATQGYFNNQANGRSWNANIDQNAINQIQGACIQGDYKLHFLCDQTLTTLAGSANNVYIRDQGTCVNSQDVCNKFGVSYNPSMGANQLGGNDPEGRNYPSCYTNSTDTWASYILGTDWVRFYNSGAHTNFNPSGWLNTGSQVGNAVINPLSTLPGFNGYPNFENAMVNTICTGALDGIAAATIESIGLAQTQTAAAVTAGNFALYDIVGPVLAWLVSPGNSQKYQPNAQGLLNAFGVRT
jgi:hypothetical protein